MILSIRKRAIGAGKASRMGAFHFSCLPFLRTRSFTYYSTLISDPLSIEPNVFRIVLFFALDLRTHSTATQWNARTHSCSTATTHISSQHVNSICPPAQLATVPTTAILHSSLGQAWVFEVLLGGFTDGMGFVFVFGFSSYNRTSPLPYS